MLCDCKICRPCIRTHTTNLAHKINETNGKFDFVHGGYSHSESLMCIAVSHRMYVYVLALLQFNQMRNKHKCCAVVVIIFLFFLFRSRIGLLIVSTPHRILLFNFILLRLSIVNTMCIRADRVECEQRIDSNQTWMLWPLLHSIHAHAFATQMFIENSFFFSSFSAAVYFYFIRFVPIQSIRFLRITLKRQYNFATLLLG